MHGTNPFRQSRARGAVAAGIAWTESQTVVVTFLRSCRECHLLAFASWKWLASTRGQHLSSKHTFFSEFWILGVSVHAGSSTRCGREAAMQGSPCWRVSFTSQDAWPISPRRRFSFPLITARRCWSGRVAGCSSWRARSFPFPPGSHFSRAQHRSDVLFCMVLAVSLPATT